MSKPLIIDSGEFAREGLSLHGEIALRDLQRVLGSVQSDTGVIRYALQGGVDKLQRRYLRLSVTGEVSLLCQRCMLPFVFAIDSDSLLTLFNSEADIDAASEQDETLEGILADREQSVVDLIEDEILLALPLAPKHEVCASDGNSDSVAKKPNPFAVLQQLKVNKQADPD
ncbi:MAG: YceD family protein [Chitinivorax sp.]